jgi:hypothetical protein
MRKSYERSYPGFGRGVLSSIAQVRLAGRSHPETVEAQGKRHKLFMDYVRAALGLKG